MKQAIESVFTESRHRLCMWHIMKKVADKVGPTFCNNEDFKRRICNIVWTYSVEPDEFEMTWHEIVNEFVLIENSWISTAFGFRSMWIPAYYRDGPLSGLMHTTSRSEKLEADALKRYTETIFWDVQEEIYCSINRCHPVGIVEDGPNAKIVLKIEKLLEKVSLSCKRFEQYGLLCRHVFVAFSVFEIDEIPKKYILRRWMRDAVSNKSKCSIFGKDVANDDIDKANGIVRDIMFATENICNMLFTDIETLSKVRDQINGMREKAEEGSQAKPILKKNDMLASLLVYDQPSTSTIRVPTGIRNKGAVLTKYLNH
ncbi:protein FAR1-RELATED SEQUENCE 5-like [Bidens hawaiensis]|uniref:protein FAR1-RELATED SEQUENCE 5-like n=1 Tax=Bidens hawaiensis TaxID=980011 RepID=UPI00404AE97F